MGFKKLIAKLRKELVNEKDPVKRGQLIKYMWYLNDVYFVSNTQGISLDEALKVVENTESRRDW